MALVPTGSHPATHVYYDPSTSYYRFLLLFHSGGHLRDCPIDGRQIFEVGYIFLYVNGHGLDGVERPRPERELGRHCRGRRREQLAI